MKKESIFYVQSDAKTFWLDNKPNKHRKGHINYSVETFIVIAYLMQRFSLNQKSALQVLTILFQKLGAEIPVPSQTSISREFDKYHRLLHGWKHIIINSNDTDKAERVSISYKEPRVEYSQKIILSAEQNADSSIFISNNQEIKIKKVAAVKTPSPHNRVIAKKINTSAKSSYSKEVNHWLFQNKKLVTLVHKLLQINGTKLFDALIPLMPKIKDKHKKLTKYYLYHTLEKHPDKIKGIKAALSTDNSIYKLAYATSELTIQPFIIKYESVSGNTAYNVVIWIYCPHSKLSFIRLDNTNFAKELDNSANLSAAKISITATKKQKKLAFYVTFFDGQTTHSWDSLLPLSTPKKNKTVEVKNKTARSWDYQVQHTCLGGNISNNKVIEVVDNKPIKNLIMNFKAGNKSKLSSDSLVKHLRAWLSHLNENSEASSADNKTYHNNKHVIRVSESCNVPPFPNREVT